MTQAFLGQMPNGVSRRNFDGLKTPNPSSFGHWVCLGKKVVGKNPNGVSAKCVIKGLLTSLRKMAVERKKRRSKAMILMSMMTKADVVQMGRGKPGAVT
jgi:hypothetical protein